MVSKSAKPKKWLGLLKDKLKNDKQKQDVIEQTLAPGHSRTSSVAQTATAVPATPQYQQDAPKPSIGDAVPYSSTSSSSSARPSDNHPLRTPYQERRKTAVDEYPVYQETSYTARPSRFSGTTYHTVTPLAPPPPLSQPAASPKTLVPEANSLASRKLASSPPRPSLASQLPQSPVTLGPDLGPTVVPELPEQPSPLLAKPGDAGTSSKSIQREPLQPKAARKLDPGLSSQGSYTKPSIPDPQTTDTLPTLPTISLSPPGLKKDAPHPSTLPTRDDKHRDIREAGDGGNDHLALGKPKSLSVTPDEQLLRTREATPRQLAPPTGQSAPDDPDEVRNDGSSSHGKTTSTVVLEATDVASDSHHRTAASSSPEEISTLLAAHGYRSMYNLETPKSMYSALAWAAGSGNTKLVEILLDRKASVLPTPADLGGYCDGFEARVSSPLHRAIEQRKVGTARTLMDHFLQTHREGGMPSPEDVASLVALKDFRGKTLLALAAEKGETDLATLLLNLGSNVEEADLLGRTPLHQAARCGRSGTVRLLLERGADSQARDNHSRLAYARAVAGGYDDVALLLHDAHLYRSSFLPEAPTGLEGMVPRSELSDPPALGIQVQSLPPALEQKDAAQGPASAAKSAVCYEVRVEEPEVLKRRSGEDWDDPLPQVRYSAVVQADDDEGNKTEHERRAGKEPADNNANEGGMSEGRIRRHSVEQGTSSPPADSADVHPLEGPADGTNPAMLDWDEPFTAPSYRAPPKDRSAEKEAQPARVIKPWPLVQGTESEASGSRATSGRGPVAPGRRAMTSLERKVEEARRDSYYSSGQYDRDIRSPD